jgi:xanthosine utilization system XapX-like protein
MLLFEYVYESNTSDHRMLFSHAFARFLAGAEAPDFPSEERRQRVADFFCGSLALVWFCSDGMILTHRGLKDNLGRCRWDEIGSRKYIAMLLALIRVGMIVFIATLSQYATKPDVLAFIGLVGILVQVMLRVVGSSIFDEEESHEDFESSSFWPNVTRPQAIPAEKHIAE